VSGPARKPGKYAEEDQAIARLREELKQRFPMPEPPPPRKKRLAVTGAGVLALLGAVLWLDPAYHREHYLTAVGEQQTLHLADGSEIRLDAASELVVSWHLRSRQTELKRGQALFAVAPMTWRPFLVDAGPAAVRVVGTRFNVSRLDDAVTVTVAEGRVAVRTGADAVLLEANRQVRVDGGRSGAVVKVDAAEALAWEHGELVFESTPLSEVLGVIQRYHDKPLRLQDPRIGRLPVSGVFDSAHVERLLALLPNILPVTVSTAADGSRVIAPRSKK